MDSSDTTSKIEKIESRLSALEASQGPAGSDVSLLSYQAQTLEKLKTIRDHMQTDGTGAGKIKQERDDAIAKNTELQKEIDRLNYRVNHLVKCLNEEEKKNGAN